jgi:hypothetical protein
MAFYLQKIVCKLVCIFHWSKSSICCCCCQQELANIQDPEYAKALKDFSENTSLDELAKEVQGVKPGREEQIDILYS